MLDGKNECVVGTHASFNHTLGCKVHEKDLALEGQAGGKERVRKVTDIRDPSAQAVYSPPHSAF